MIGKRLRWSRIVAVLCLWGAVPGNADTGLVGTWLGVLNLPNGQDLRMGLEVVERTDGSLTADLISLDQGADGEPSTQVQFGDASIRIEYRRMSVFLEGELTTDGQVFDADYVQGSFRADLRFDRVESLPGLVTRWQNPQRPYPYVEELVRFDGGEAGVSLAGTLTLPAGDTRHAAVVLVSGSGPQGRDELIAYHRPFLVLADHLTRHGIAVLRYDDRGVGESTGRFGEATTLDLAADALGAVTFLRNRTDIDPQRVFIVGHSEGGMIAPMVARDQSEVAGVVLLAGPGIPIIDLMRLQYRLFSLAAGATVPQADALASMYHVIHEVLNAETDRITIYTRIQAHYDGLSDADRALLGWSRSQLNTVIESRMTPWWRYFLTFDPVVYLSQIQVPILAVNGDADLNVTAAENLAGIEQATAMAGNDDVTLVEYPGLNHMLNRTETAAGGDSIALGETVNPAVLQRVTRWIQVRAGLDVTAVESTTTTRPARLSLSPNYPNPFNGRTLIRFELPEEASAKLVLFDLTGQRLRSLVEGRFTAGSHVAMWDGRDAEGRVVASGVYLLELRAGGRVQHQTLTLLK